MPLPSLLRPRRTRRLSKRVKVMLALELAGLGAIAALLLLRGGSAAGFDGFVYVESNTARPGANAVLAYRFHGRRLTFLGAFRTRGAGTIDLGVTGSLDAEGQIAVDPQRRLLFAVNQGSDSIASFSIGRNGLLSRVPGSPFPARGFSPAGLAVDGDLLLAADKAEDPARRLDRARPAYAALRIGPGGRLTPSGQVFSAPPGSSPTQVLALPGRVVVSTEETGPFRAFLLGADGTFAQAHGSPLAPESSIFRSAYAGARWAIGLVPYPGRAILYANQAATAQLLVYTYDAAGRLRFRHAVQNEGAKLPCWTAVSRDGRHLFTANAGNGTVSAFDLRAPSSPRQLQTLRLRDGGNPWGLALDPSGRTLFVVDSRAVEGLKAGVGDRLHVLLVHPDGRLSELASVKLPVGASSSPLGIAVVPG